MAVVAPAALGILVLPVLRVLALVPLMIAARLRRIERRTIDRLTEAGADTAERAIFLEQGGALASFVYRRLTDAGALVRPGNDRYYLSEQRYQAFCTRRRRRALIVLVTLAGALAALFFTGVFS